MSSACFNQILQDVPLLSQFRLFLDAAKEFNFIGFDECSVYTAKLPPNFEGLGPSDTPKCSYQQCTLNCDVVFTFTLEGKHHALDCKGFLHQLNFTAKDEDEADLFDDSTSDDIAGPVRELFRVDSGQVLSACLVSSNHLALLSYSSAELSISLRLLSTSTFEPIHSVTIMKNVLTRPNNSFLVFADSDDIDKCFVMNWFPHFNSNEICFGYVFVLNCADSACCVQLGMDGCEFGYFFNWPTDCVFASFQRLDEGPSKSVLLLSFNDGAIVRLTCGGGDVLQFSLSKMKCAWFVKEKMICSDYSDCQVTRLSQVGNSTLLPLKGVIGFCPLPATESKALALTNFGGLYVVNLEAELGETKALIPEVSVFEETLNNINYLEQLNAKIVLQNRAIKCLSTAVNAKNLRFNVGIQVVQIIGQTHVFRITAEILSVQDSSAFFHADDWHAVFSLSSKSDDTVVQVQKLCRDFSPDLPLELMVKLELRNDALRDYVSEVKLISLIGIGKYLPTLVLGKVFLNVLYFLEPEQSLLVYSAASSKTPPLVDLLRQKKKAHSSPIEPNKSVLTIDVPLNEPVERARFVEKLLCKSQALWRAESWNDACANPSFSVVVAGYKASISLKDTTATVSSDNLSLAILLKHAVLKSFGTTAMAKLGERDLIEAEDMLKNLEIMEFSRDGPNVSQLLEVFKRKLKVINDAFSGTSSTLTS